MQSSIRPFAVSSSALHAKKKRRRRRDSEADGDMSNSSESDDLPDFELDDDEGEQQPKRKPKKVMATADPDKITPAMMGNADQPVRSLEALISDRSLESKFEFDDVDETDESLPDLVALSRASAQDAPVRKKKTRQAERKAAAIAAKENEEDEGLFSNLPFVSDDEGKVRPIKVRSWSCCCMINEVDLQRFVNPHTCNMVTCLYHRYWRQELG